MKKVRKAAAVVTLAVVGVLGMYVVSQSAPALGQPQAARPEGLPAPAALTAEQKTAMQQELEAQGKIKYLSGPMTRGQKVEFGGHTVQLPADAYVKQFIVSVDCDPARPCIDDVPYLVIERGQSTIYVSAKAGKVLREKLAPGQERAFDFLQGVVTR
ncbi:MAG TPA: hypothetical protein VK464_07920 [Symbiobacteriaceae bacterium]|nr:hypothetical protein [Symbiobacteriaceae bacterium]